MPEKPKPELYVTPEEKPSAPPSEFPPELQEYLPVVKRFIENYRELFFAIARDRSLDFKPGLGFSIDLKAGVINLDVESWKLQKERGLSEWQQIWSVCHEISHFYDLREAPKEMLENFEYLERRAKELEPQVLEIWKRKFGGKLPDYLSQEIPIGRKGERTMTVTQKFLYDKLHLLYNSLDDIYVNGTLALRSTVFDERTGSQAPEVRRLYRDYLFPTKPKEVGSPPKKLEAADYATLPKSYQLAYALLRRRMVPDQEILISDEVRKKLQGFKDKAAEELGITLEKEVANFTSPANRKAEKPGWRYERIRKTVEPIFVEFLLKDIKDLPPPPPPEGEGPVEPEKEKFEVGDPVEVKATGQKGYISAVFPDGSVEVTFTGPLPEKGTTFLTGSEFGKQIFNNPIDELWLDIPFSPGRKPPKRKGPQIKPQPRDPWEPLDDKPEPIDLDTIRDFIKQQEEKRKEKEAKDKERERKARLTPEERQREAERAEDQKICERYEIDPRLAEEYREIERSIEPYKRELAAVFEQIMNTVSERVTKFWEEGYRSGKFNVERFIRKYAPELVAEEEVRKPVFVPWNELDVYAQRAFIERLVLFPNRLRVRLILDGSGSMGTDRILALKQLSVLMLEALSSFEATINLRFKLKEPIRVDTEIRMFGSPGASRIVKSFAQGKTSEEEELTDRFRTFGQINNGYGGTCDAEPFWAVADSIDPALTSDLEAGRAKEFVFEITDGGSNETSKRAKSGDTPAQDTRNAIGAVERAGAICRAFQIGEPSEEEKETFDQIWGKEAGAHIPHPKDLTEAVAKLLASEITKMEIKVEYYPEEE